MTDSKVNAPHVSHTEIVPLANVVDAAREFMAQSKAENTKIAYASDWKHFEAWCNANDLGSLPATPQTIALYLTAHADELKVSTLQRRLASISAAHRQKEHNFDTRHPALREVWAGIRRAKGTAPATKTPTLTNDIIAMVSNLPDTLIGTRDRALLLIGFAGAFRRSELVALEVADLNASNGDGLIINLRRSKTDQEGRGRTVGIPFGTSPLTCPVKALETWRALAGIDEGRIFRGVTRHGTVGNSLTVRSVVRIVKQAAEGAGLDPADYAGHSLRSGFATSAAAAGASERSIMNQTGHKSLPMVRRYIREGSLFRENAATKLGL